MAAPVQAQLLAQVPGVTDDIVVAGDLVYLAGGAGVQIVDLADPAQPQVVSSYDTPGWPRGLDLVGSRLYVADGTDTSVFPYEIGAGLLILDVSSPAAPAELGRLETPGIASTVEVAASLAYLVDDSLGSVSAGLHIIDVSTPATPTEVGSVVGFSTMHDGDLELPLAFGVSAYGFGIADVSIPAMPEVRAVLPIATSAVHAVGNLAYVASGFFDWDADPALRIYDASDPSAPVQLSEMLFDLMDGAGRDIAVVGTTVYLLTSRQLIVLDATNPAQPTVRKRVALPAPSWPGEKRGALALRDDLVLVGADQLFVYRVDLGLPDCNDALDNDGDGRIDASDGGCVDASDFSEWPACSDGVDSDGDGLVDLADAGCKNASDPSEQTDCGDGADNDGDGAIDLADPGCGSDEDLSEQSAALACDDGLDDDGDGRVDYYGASPDPGCVALTDPSEQEATLACDNGIDDDGDGAVDFRVNCSATSSCDTGCSDLLDASEQDPAVACDDGADNDADGAIDHPADANCSSRIDRSEGELVVNSATDGFDAIPGDGLCADAAGACTLRAAIDETNALVGSDDVMVPAGSYVLAQGALTIDDDTTLTGAGADLTVIDAGGTDTVAVIGSYETEPRVRLRDLTITGGRLQFPGFAILGAAGISSLFADLELDGVVVQGNAVDAALFPIGAGGILQVGGHLRILRSTIAGNTGRSVPGLPMAGGVEVMSWTDGGKAPGTAASFCYPAALEVVNSTIGDNVGGGLGVGRSSYGCDTTAKVTSTTIAANEGSGLGAGSLGTTLTLRSSIVAQQGSGADCELPASLAISAGHNLDGDGTCHLTDPTDLPDTDPLLGPLQDNGGPTETHALLPGSPAINAIPLADCRYDDDGDPSTPEVPLTTDQRGVARPQGAGCDIGAVEVSACANGLDDDGDGLVDHPADPGCKNAQSKNERPECQDALDNDGDGKLDFDGGASANHGVALGPPDPQCTQPWRTTEIPAPSCGLGAELVMLLPAIGLLRRRRRARSPRSKT